VDNPRIGPELARVWWQPGNSVRFADFVVRLTGKPLGATALADRINATADMTKRGAREAIARLGQIPEKAAPVELEGKIRVVHGHELVAELDGDFEAFCRQFTSWIDAARQPNASPRPASTSAARRGGNPCQERCLRIWVSTHNYEVS
jgi:hypothetical protein